MTCVKPYVENRPEAKEETGEFYSSRKVLKKANMGAKSKQSHTTKLPTYPG